MKISISRDGDEIGEWTEEEVRDFYREGRLFATDFYWAEGMAEWKELGTFLKPPPPRPKKITIKRGGQNYSYTLEKIKEYLGNGTINESDWAWQEGCADWLPLREIIASLASPPPPLFTSQSPEVPPTTTAIPQAFHQNTIQQEVKRTGLSRLPFLGLFLLTLFICTIATTNSSFHELNTVFGVLALVVLCVIIALRLMNIGYAQWPLLVVVAFLPLVGLIVLLLCFLKPPGSAIKTPK